MMIIEHHHMRKWLGILASIFLGMTFIVAGSSKLLAGMVKVDFIIYPEYLSSLLVDIAFTSVPWLELIAGTLLVAGIVVKVAACFSLLLITGFITSNILIIALGLEECFSCFGELADLSAFQALCLDGIMVALAVTILVFYPGRFFSKRPWYWGNR